jgi:hypothetical protein
MDLNFFKQWTRGDNRLGSSRVDHKSDLRRNRIGGKLHLHALANEILNLHRWVSGAYRVLVEFVKNRLKINGSGLDRPVKVKMVLHPHPSMQIPNPNQTKLTCFIIIFSQNTLYWTDFECPTGYLRVWFKIQTHTQKYQGRVWVDTRVKRWTRTLILFE